MLSEANFQVPFPVLTALLRRDLYFFPSGNSNNASTAFGSMETRMTASFPLSAIKRLNIKLNLGYLAFSVSMLLLVIVSIAMLAINPLQTTIVLISSCTTVAFYTYMIKRQFNSKALSYTIKFFGVIFIIFAVLLMSICLHLISAFIIALIIYIIFEYSTLFIKRNGLLKNKIKETEKIKSYLESNVLTVSITQEFTNHQANIYAFELDKIYTQNEKNKKVYLLDIVKEIENIL